MCKLLLSYFISKSPMFLLYSLIASLIAILSPATSEARIRILSPQDGTVVTAGQTVTVTLRPSQGATLDSLLVSTNHTNMDEWAMFEHNAPVQVSVKVPNDVLGPVILSVIATEINGEASIDKVVGLIVQPPSPAQNIKVQPSNLAFGNEVRPRFIRVDGLYADGVARDIHAFSTTFTSANPLVATVDSKGLVTPVGSGITTITVSHSGFSAQVPVKVRVFRRGDFTDDDFIDQTDVDIVIAVRGTLPTGPGDPRDLNNDGAINEQDEELVRNLCSRPQCSTVH